MKREFQKTAAWLCDIITMPMRACLYDTKKSYEEGGTVLEKLRLASAEILLAAGFCSAPIIIGCFVEMPMTTVLLTVLSCSAYAPKHPLASNLREGWEPFPLLKGCAARLL